MRRPALMPALVILALLVSSAASADEICESLHYQLPFAGEEVSLPVIPSKVPSAAFKPAIAIVIDDVGYHSELDGRVLRTRGALTLAVMPDAPAGARLSEEAAKVGKEIMLHLPMQASAGKYAPGALKASMSESEFKARVGANLDALPRVRGLNNHEGGFLTAQTRPMTWLMEVLRDRSGLYFLDSRTSPDSLAQQLAAEHGIASLKRDVFLDGVTEDPGYVHQQFDKLVRQARQRGEAVGIGHPFPDTLDVIEERLAQLHLEGVQLLTVSGLLDHKIRRQVWQASSSRSRTAAKNLKPSLSSTY